MDDLFEDDEQEQTQTSSQSKSLLANTYSNRGISGDSYKDLSDWETLTDDEIELAYLLTAPNGRGSAVVQETLDDYGAGYEEWFQRLVINLAHIFGEAGVHIPEFEERDTDPRGATPMLDFFGVAEDDIIDYLAAAQAGDVETDVDPMNVLERLQQAAEAADDEETEPAEADD